MSQQLQIINYAFHQCGSERINSLSENNKRARLASDIYELSRNEALAEGYWSSALCNQTLDYDILEDGIYKFRLPTDLIRIKSCSVPHTKDGEYIYTQSKQIQICYVSSDAIKNTWSPLLKKAIGLKLAADMSYSITQNPDLQQLLEKRYRMVVDDGLGYSTLDSGESVVEVSSEVNDVRTQHLDTPPDRFNT